MIPNQDKFLIWRDVMNAMLDRGDQALQPKPPGKPHRKPQDLPHAEAYAIWRDTMKCYVDTAKSYVQVSAAALALPLIFTQAILGKNIAEGGMLTTGVPWPLTVSWACFLISVAAGLLYQWQAIRQVWNSVFDQDSSINRSKVYGLMVISFMLGAFFFVIFA